MSTRKPDKDGNYIAKCRLGISVCPSCKKEMLIGQLITWRKDNKLHRARHVECKPCKDDGTCPCWSDTPYMRERYKKEQKGETKKPSALSPYYKE